VVDRKVEPGQTVAASFQAPVLFTIAQDLSKVEVRISVDEADVGQVREGQAVRFTVDAFPDDAFTGVVTQVRKQPTTTQNVVAYTVIAEADNPARMLLPGMTANADIIIDVRRNVLKIPATALRWTPPAPPRRGPDNADAKPAAPPPTRAPPSADGMRPGTVYVVRDDAPKAIAVRVGATDGTVVEVVSAELKAGDQVILGGGPKAGPRGFGGGPPPSVRARLGE
jgi:HlyD family secretion protein